MDIFVARQPIFDREQNVYGYELLYRQGNSSNGSSFSGDQATSEVIINSFLLIGIDELTQGKPAFINFTENLLMQEIPTVFPKELIAVEILETIEPTDEVIESCKKLKQMGYKLVLDDFIYDPKWQPLIELADIIKVDFLSTTPQERRSMFTHIVNNGIQFLAEKVETREQFTEALEMGYSYFQGYFFSKPVILSGKGIPPYDINSIQLLKELHKEDPDIDQIAKWIECDISMAYKLLRLVNSAAFQVRGKITSIKQALVLLGLNEFSKWTCLTLIQNIGEKKPDIIIRDCMFRAKFGEQLAIKCGLRKRSSEVFLMGMFSKIDALMNVPINEALRELPIAEDIKNCLKGSPSKIRDLYDLILYYEKGDWDRCLFYTNRLELINSEVVNLYLKSIKWVNMIFGKRDTKIAGF